MDILHRQWDYALNAVMNKEPLALLGLGTGVCVSALVIYIIRLRRRVESSPEMDKCTVDYKKDLVYFWTFQRPTRCIPDMSPYGLKVETFLRIANISYEAHNIKFNERSKKGQIPFIYINGEQFADSVCILNELERRFTTMDQDLTPAEKGVQQAFAQMMDQATVWTYFWYRYVTDNIRFWRAIALPVGRLPNFFVPRLVRFGIRKRATEQGTGRNSEAEIWELARKDLEAISKYLGNKTYFMGDKPAKIDAVLFGHLAQIMYIDIDYPHRAMIQQDFPNIATYIENIKRTYWPDWDDLINRKTT